MDYPWLSETWARLVAGKDRLPNALLLYGRSGIGKFDFALDLAKALLCENQLQSGEACGQCGSCGWLQAGVHPDFRLLEPEAQSEAIGDGEGAEPAKPSDKKASQFITVAQVRELADFVNLSTHRNGLRIVLVRPAEAMNIHAANALLKTLEEPPAHTLFILVAHQLQRLLPTVRSRCQMIGMPLPESAMAENWLRERGVGDPSGSLSQAGGAPLAALDLSDSDYQQKRGQVMESLGVPDRLDPLALAELGEKLGLPDMILWLQQWVIDLISLGLVGRPRYQAQPSDAMRRLANTINLIELFQFQQELSVVQRTLQHPLNGRLVLEQLLFSYWQLVNRQEAAHVRS